jgi:hypothetical protein
MLGPNMKQEERRPNIDRKCHRLCWHTRACTHVHAQMQTNAYVYISTKCKKKRKRKEKEKGKRTYANVRILVYIPTAT